VCSSDLIFFEQTHFERQLSGVGHGGSFKSVAQF